MSGNVVVIAYRTTTSVTSHYSCTQTAELTDNAFTGSWSEMERDRCTSQFRSNGTDAADALLRDPSGAIPGLNRMQTSDLEAYRRVLEALVADIRGSLEQIDTTPVSPDNAIGRLTRVDAMQSQQLAMEMHRRQIARLREVEEALRRVGRGEYGECSNCGEDISPARLRVKPEARLCVQCASR